MNTDRPSVSQAGRASFFQAQKPKTAPAGRLCECGARLSRYNQENICGPCRRRLRLTEGRGTDLRQALDRVLTTRNGAQPAVEAPQPPTVGRNPADRGTTAPQVEPPQGRQPAAPAAGWWGQGRLFDTEPRFTSEPNRNP